MQTFNFGLNDKNRVVAPKRTVLSFEPSPNLPIKSVNSNLAKDVVNSTTKNNNPNFYPSTVPTSGNNPTINNLQAENNPTINNLQAENNSNYPTKATINNQNYTQKQGKFVQARDFEGQKIVDIKTPSFKTVFTVANLRWLVLFLVVSFFAGSILVFINNNLNYFDPVLKVSKILPSEQFQPNYPKPATDFSVTQTMLVDLPSEIQTQQIKIKDATSFVPKVDTKDYKNFTGEQFRSLYDNFVYSKVLPGKLLYPITGDNSADAQIRKLAETRGYKQRPQAIEAGLESIDGQSVQLEVKTSWLALKSAAASEGLNLVLVSGYRSLDDQKSLFVQDLGNTYSNEQIGLGLADKKIDSILKTRSIPGYSRHHTGYTIDIGCNDTNLLPFGDTKCYEWLSVYNFLNSKRFGFIPSYPAGAKNQGPDPEPWEFVWVGENSVK